MKTKFYQREKCNCDEKIKSFPYLKKKDCPFCHGKDFTRGADITELMLKLKSRMSEKAFIIFCEQDCEDLIEVVEE
ncbi:MAG: hypothetical protein AABY22_14360 [Nanoarchaeota archaeon]